MGHWVSNVLRVIRWYYVYMGACYVDFWKRQLHDSNVLFLWYTIRKILSYMIPLYAMSTLNKCGCTEISVQFSLSVVSNSLQPHELQHARPPCPSPSPGVHSDTRPSSQWCHPAISSSVIPFSSCPQSLPASVFSNESTLRMRWPKYWSFSFNIICSKEIPGLISFRIASWLSLQSKRFSRVFSNTTVQKHQFLGAQLSSQSSSHIHTWPLEKP